MNRILSILFFLVLANNNLFGQKQKSPIYELEQRLMHGDKNALFDIASYFDSKKEITEFLGHHIIETNESAVAKRIIDENCIFTKQEIAVTNKTTGKDFLCFLNKNSNKITFSSLADAFLITPLELRSAKIEFREISTNRMIELRSKYPELLKLEWVKKAKIDLLILRKDPKVLLVIASELFKIRYRFNRSHFNEDEYIELLQVLTNIEIAVEDEKGTMTWHIDKAFYPDATLNLLIYFSNNFFKFHWDDERLVFSNRENKISSAGKEDYLFELLNNKNDSIAIDAFIQLTTCHPQKVIQLANEYQSANIETSNAIPTFPYSFLKQMVVLTNYCRDNQFDFVGSKSLRADIHKLKSDLSFFQRRKLEDKLINTMTLDDITAFEYWALIHEQSYRTTYSAGRILDIFYSKNWKQILNNERYLKFYLKKSHLFGHLGIIGSCSNYLKKFTNQGTTGTKKLTLVKTNDNETKMQIEEAKKICLVKLKRPDKNKKMWEGNRDFHITAIEDKIRGINKIKDREKMEDALQELLSQINYNQIGKALKEIENIPLEKDIYSFLESDWGFFMVEDWNRPNTRTAFLKLYNTLNEYDLYAYYIDKAGVDYKNRDNSLNYDKIFELLKYDVVDAFVGGGGGLEDNEVYSVIKLLEITHKTTLGYPKKFCNSNGTWGCDSQGRANEWMQFLIDHKLLKEEHNEAVSFHY